MKLTMERAKEMMAGNGGSLYLRNTGITSLPEGLTVAGWLDLSNTGITSLPEGLTVNGRLDLRNTGITSLPEGLTVNGWLDLRNTAIPGSEREKARRPRNGEYVPGRYLYCDGILTHVKSKREVNGYTLYVGKIRGRNVVSDGEYFAHCRTFREGIADIAFKRAADRGAEQFRGMDMDKPLPLEECKTMYRIITGACRQGTESFAASLGDALKETYTIREMLEVTKGQYNAERFAEFFGEDAT